MVGVIGKGGRMRKLVLGLTLLYGLLVPPNLAQAAVASASFITATEAATLPTSGNGFNNAQWVANLIKTNPTPNLGDINGRAGSEALTAAVFWLAGGKTDSVLLESTRTFILKSPG